MRHTLFALAAILTVACAPDSGLAPSEEAEDQDAALSLKVEELGVSKSNAPPGLTILRTKAEYAAFFGQAPPSDLSFNKSWVVHHSMGVQPTGGHDANVLSIDREGSGASARLVVHSQDVYPGPNCIVTMALTNPQVTVKIPKQKKSIAVDHLNDASFTDCGTVQGWCLAAKCVAGQVCDEFQDACVEEPFCPKVKCANGYVCDEDVDACVGRPCDPQDAGSCPAGFACENQIQCITVPCPEEYRCEPAPADPCQGIDFAGTCEGTVLKYCDQGTLHTVECAPAECGWNASAQYYDCL